ncbi:MAG TPA: osmotically inducible protein OsmC [Candidatus Marinimicrobia bacterium]|nr:MAG: osmotically inducible protein OsmC [Candidatus Marinimicrobia bacterium CG1_02_48_14]PIZ69316.1 MAG: osmotically inducible protein OsmC [Candidatus Marinimicrobia bacterium CG_4_10_14_0_2_um_filter_48_9]PJA54352.1 MAG: osmotically inducible protein OsmC [Candidatus Marinimicrobia bacterium CG_4_9_14_3_um_filter_48_9]HCW77119.1 osmotically inducible protein OsmC [Candidatus Neomarinimicrobiota bacterium]
MAVTIQQVGTAATFLAKGDSGHWVAMDGNAQVGGSDAAARPMELVLFGLGGCTAMDVVSILNKMKVPLEDFHIAIESERAETHPKVYTKIEMTYHFYGNDLPLEKLERAVHLSEKTYCSVSAMLSKTVDISVKIENHNTAVGV